MTRPRRSRARADDGTATAALLKTRRAHFIEQALKSLPRVLRESVGAEDALRSAAMSASWTSPEAAAAEVQRRAPPQPPPQLLPACRICSGDSEVLLTCRLHALCLRCAAGHVAAEAGGGGSHADHFLGVAHKDGNVAAHWPPRCPPDPFERGPAEARSRCGGFLSSELALRLVPDVRACAERAETAALPFRRCAECKTYTDLRGALPPQVVRLSCACAGAKLICANAACERPHAPLDCAAAASLERQIFAACAAMDEAAEQAAAEHVLALQAAACASVLRPPKVFSADGVALIKSRFGCRLESPLLLPWPLPRKPELPGVPALRYRYAHPDPDAPLSPFLKVRGARASLACLPACLRGNLNWPRRIPQGVVPPPAMLPAEDADAYFQRAKAWQQQNSAGWLEFQRLDEGRAALQDALCRLPAGFKESRAVLWETTPAFAAAVHNAALDAVPSEPKAMHALAAAVLDSVRGEASARLRRGIQLCELSVQTARSALPDAEDLREAALARDALPDLEHLHESASSFLHLARALRSQLEERANLDTRSKQLRDCADREAFAATVLFQATAASAAAATVEAHCEQVAGHLAVARRTLAEAAAAEEEAEDLQLGGAADKKEIVDSWELGRVRPCPNCGILIERESGCNSVTCAACKQAFCWSCLAKTPHDHGTEACGGEISVVTLKALLKKLRPDEAHLAGARAMAITKTRRPANLPGRPSPEASVWTLGCQPSSVELAFAAMLAADDDLIRHLTAQAAAAGEEAAAMARAAAARAATTLAPLLHLCVSTVMLQGRPADWPGTPQHALARDAARARAAWAAARDFAAATWPGVKAEVAADLLMNINYRRQLEFRSGQRSIDGQAHAALAHVSVSALHSLLSGDSLPRSSDRDAALRLFAETTSRESSFYYVVEPGFNRDFPFTGNHAAAIRKLFWFEQDKLPFVQEEQLLSKDLTELALRLYA